MYENFIKRFVVVAFLGLFIVACGSGGGGGGAGSSSGGGGSSDDLSLPTTIVKVSGDNQVAAMGESVASPLVVRVLNEKGAACSGVSVSLSLVSGDAGAFTDRAVTDSDGAAGFSVTVGSGFEDLVFRAESVGIGNVIFSVSPRLPFLGEVKSATLDEEVVADMPVIGVYIADVGVALALLTGDAPELDETGMPSAGSLEGLTVEGTTADNMPVLFIPADKILDSDDYTIPESGDLSGKFMAGQFADDLPAVGGFVVNARPAIMAINGDASAISGVTNLGDLLGSGDGSEVRLLKAGFYPEEPETDKFTYFAVANKLLPVFGSTLSLDGSSEMTALPLIENEVNLTDAALSALSGGAVESAPVFGEIAPQLSKLVPSGPINSAPVEYETAIEIVQDEIIPIEEAARDLFDTRDALLNQLGEVLLDNIDSLQLIIEGEISDPLEVASFVSEALPIIDELIVTEISILDVRDAELDVVIADLIPAIADALPENGIPFGGTSDGDPSTVADDVLPLIKQELTILHDAIPDIKTLLADLGTMIPNDGDVLALISNAQNGGLETLLTDLNTVKPYLVEGLWLLNYNGIPIFYDMLEEAEYRIKPGDLQVEDLDIFKTAVAYLELKMPADTTLGDIKYFEIWGPMISGYLPSEWGETASVSVFGVIVPYIGQLDIGGDVLPAVRGFLDAVAGFLPRAIQNLDEFSFLSLLE